MNICINVTNSISIRSFSPQSFNMEGGYLKFLNALWAGYPEQHSVMPWGLKLFYILQMAYWVHVFPELYLTKVKKVKILYFFNSS